MHESHVVSLRALAGIVAYEPGDLTITVRAGTTLRELADATRPRGQWLALDPAGSADGTIGATVATASSGPLAHAFGTPRDLVLGLEAVTGTGDVIRAGGRVVKNVAGFDLVRLLTGSWGTLGAITEVSLRLHARPAHDATFALALPPVADPAFAATLARAVERVRAPDMAPIALEVVGDWGGAAPARPFAPEQPEFSASARHPVRSAPSAAPSLLVRLGGNATRVAAQRAALASLGDVAECDESAWDAVRLADDGTPLVLRVGTAASALPFAIPTLLKAAPAGVAMSWHATPARGIVRIAARGPHDALRALLQAVLDSTRTPTDPPRTLVVERAPAGFWAAVPDATGDPLSHRVRDALDPARVLNRRVPIP
jgi:glycolate oxidase FAD binding subunit